MHFVHVHGLNVITRKAILAMAKHSYSLSAQTSEFTDGQVLEVKPFLIKNYSFELVPIRSQLAEGK